MKNFILIIDVVLIILTAVLGTNVYIYLKKSDSKKIEDIRNFITPRLKKLQILIVLLTILGIILALDNAFKFL